MKAQHHHNDHGNPLLEGCCDALHAQGLIGLSEQPDHRLAKLAQGTSPRAGVCLFDARTGHLLEC